MSKETIFNFSIDCNSVDNVFHFEDLNLQNKKSFIIKIQFSQPIISFRNHNYQWVDLSQNRIANDFSPKIIQLQNGTFVQANVNSGIWEITPKETNVLFWKFNPQFSNPITQYSGKINTKKIKSANTTVYFPETPKLLFSNSNAIEISRSPIPFAAVTCFTDHCDYDTSENLKIQREFFKKYNLKITKGFFLNHFSKRHDNASYQNDKDELMQWQNDNHEMCYHSLTQSIREESESINEFKTFNLPFKNANVWIDHGFQPYNFTMFEKSLISSKDFEDTLLDKNINVLWNYIDAGNATTGIINQLNPSQFNLEKYYKSIQSEPFKTRMILMFKNIIFHYDNNQFRVRNYIDALAHAKAILIKKRFLEIFGLIKNVIPLICIVLKVLFLWKNVKKQTYKVAQYSPLFFRHKIENNDFYIFQTIEMVDFINALNKQNIDSLIQESGVFIAHTYFSVNSKNYKGKLINTDNSINSIVESNFGNLSEKITKKIIWNPTLTEFLNHYKNFQNVVFDIDEKGAIFIKNNFNIPSRTVQ